MTLVNLNRDHYKLNCMPYFFYKFVISQIMLPISFLRALLLYSTIPIHPELYKPHFKPRSNTIPQSSPKNASIPNYNMVAFPIHHPAIHLDFSITPTYTPAYPKPYPNTPSSNHIQVLIWTYVGSAGLPRWLYMTWLTIRAPSLWRTLRWLRW